MTTTDRLREAAQKIRDTAGDATDGEWTSHVPPDGRYLHERRVPLVGSGHQQPRGRPMTTTDGTTMSATDAIANALDCHQAVWIGHQEGWDCGCNEHGNLGPWLTLGEIQHHQADAVIAAVRSMPVEDQAELIGGDVETAPAYRMEFVQRGVRAIGPWKADTR